MSSQVSVSRSFSSSVDQKGSPLHFLPSSQAILWFLDYIKFFHTTHCFLVSTLYHCLHAAQQAVMCLQWLLSITVHTLMWYLLWSDTPISYLQCLRQLKLVIKWGHSIHGQVQSAFFTWLLNFLYLLEKCHIYSFALCYNLISYCILWEKLSFQ